jgi:hypothetical protein
MDLLQRINIKIVENNQRLENGTSIVTAIENCRQREFSENKVGVSSRK